MFKLDPLASSSLCNFCFAQRFDPGDMLYYSYRLILKSQFGELENNDVDEGLSISEKSKLDFNVISSCSFFPCI